ncbi:LysR family transcriptional regulator [Bacillus salitolerans]|uniref:LysR family transcriptional regulator n=1 Tax=Bacillus salitolerans TaxID=1437434 RepID=A0ABW4LQ99_9BACI
MEIDQLRAFIAVVQTKNFTKAAETLHVAQSTITTRIKSLEDSIGKSLFERDNRTVQLTSSGKVFLPYAQKVLELIQKSRNAINSDNYFDKYIVVGSTHTIWDYVLYPIVRDFQDHNRNIGLRFITNHSQEVIQGIMDGIIDIAVVYLRPHHPEIQVNFFREEHIHLVGSKTYFDELEVVGDNVLRNYPFIHLDWGTPFSEWFNEVIGKDEPFFLQVDHMSIHIQYLLEGKGIGFMPTSVLERYKEEGLVELPTNFSKPIPTRPMYIIYLKRKHEFIQSLLSDLNK